MRFEPRQYPTVNRVHHSRSNFNDFHNENRQQGKTKERRQQRGTKWIIPSIKNKVNKEH